MRRAVLLLLLLLVPGTAQAAPDADPAAEAALDRAVQWLTEATEANYQDCLDTPPDRWCRDMSTWVETVEAVVAVGIDPRAWPAPDHAILDRVAVPDNTRAGDNHPDEPSRELYAVTHGGYDPRDHQGRDLWAQARDATDAVVESGNSGFLTFLLMTLTHDPDGQAEADRAAQALKLAQRASGGWDCNSMPSSDCTSFAIVALAAHGSLDDITRERAMQALEMFRSDDGGYKLGFQNDEGNANSAAWALMAHRAVGRPDDPDLLRFLLDLQHAEGWFYWSPSYRTDGNVAMREFASLEVIVALASGHPLPGYAPPTLPATVSVGVPVELTLGPDYDDGTWTFPDATFQGTRATHTFPHLGEHAFHLAALGDRHQYRGPASIEATNAAPTLHLPTSLQADRTAPLALAPTVTDPDGHATTATYRLGDITASLPASLLFTELGEHTLQVTARDDWGGTAVATTTVTVQNLSPVIDAVALPATVQAGEPFTTTVQGRDPDGAAPTITWSTGGQEQHGATATWTLPEGQHPLSVTLRDVDGAETTSHHAVHAVAGGAPPEPAPTITGLTATVDGGRLHVDATVDPPGAALRLQWTVDGIPFTRDAVTLPRTETLPAGARSIDAVHLTATTTGGEAHAEAGPLPVAPDEPAPAGPQPEPQPSPEPVQDDAPPQPAEPPRIDGLQLRTDGGALTVTATVHPADARVDLAVLLDGLGTVHHDAAFPFTQELDPGVREVQVHVVASTGSHSTAVELGPVRLEPAPAAPESLSGPGPEPVAEAPPLTTSTPGAPLPLALVALAGLAALRRRR